MSEGLPCKEWYDFLPALGAEGHRHREQISNYINQLNKPCYLKIKCIYCRIVNSLSYSILFKQRLSDHLPDILLRSLVAENCALCYLGGETPPYLNPQGYGGPSHPVFFSISLSILHVGVFFILSSPELSRNISLSYRVLEGFWSFRTVVPNFHQWLKYFH